MVVGIYFEKKNLFESKDLISKLTPREYGVLKSKSEGFSTKLTADQLQISENTVTFHLLNIRRKLKSKKFRSINSRNSKWTSCKTLPIQQNTKHNYVEPK